MRLRVDKSLAGLILLSALLLPDEVVSVPLKREKTIARNSKPLAVSAAHIAHVAQTLGLKYPFELRRMETFRDGGSWSGILLDTRGDSLQWCWQAVWAEGDAREPSPSRLWLGAYAYDRPGAKLVETGSDLEVSVAEAMRLYVETYVAPEQQDSLLATPYYYLQRLSEEQRNAKKLLQIVRTIEGRANGRR